VGVLGSPSLDHQLQQGVMQLLALGMEVAQAYLEAAAGGSPGISSGRADRRLSNAGHADTGGVCESELHDLYVYNQSTILQLLQLHCGRLLAGGDPATALQLVAMLRGLAAVHQQVRCCLALLPHPPTGRKCYHVR
jgi:hypothetical protein